MIHLGNVSDLCEYTDALISETARMAEENTCTINAPTVLHLSDVDLQEFLIGKRTDIDEQYKHNGRKQQLRINMPPDGYSNEGESPKERSCGTSPVKLRRGGALKDTEKKLIKPGSNTIKEALKPMPLPRSHSRDKDTNGQSKGASCASGAKPGEVSPGTHDIGTLKQVAEGNRESHSLLQNLCKVPQLTADVSSVNSLSSGPFAECNNGSLLRTIICEDGLAVCGITILDSNIYTVFQNSNNIQVYDSAALVFRNSFTIDEMVNPNDLTSCSLNNCLYICDWGNGRIFRFEVGEGGQHMSWSIDADLGGLSVTAEHNVLLSGHASNKLKEYTSKGQLIRSVTLKDYLNPWHAIKLISNDFIICHGDSLRESGNHRVCLVDANGKLKAFFGGAKGSDEEHMFGPYYLAVDKNDCILVSDCNNRRILLLSQDLKFIKEIIPSSTNVLRRARRMYLDEAAGRLYVADNVSTGRETKDGRILVFSIT